MQITYTTLKIIKLSFTYNHFQNISRLFDVLPNFSFTTSKTMRDYKHRTHEMNHELPNDLRLRMLGNYEICGKCLNFIKWVPSVQSPHQNESFVNTSKNLLKNRN